MTSSERRQAWVARQNPRHLGMAGKLRWAGVPEPDVQQFQWAAHRMRYGLEARALVALVHAPELRAEAGTKVAVSDFLTPIYAALAAVLLDPATPKGVLEVARRAVAGRAYLPSPEGGWLEEARWCLAELVARRARWTVAKAERRAGNVARAERRRKRISAGNGRVRADRRELRELLAELLKAAGIPTTAKGSLDR